MLSIKLSIITAVLNRRDTIGRAIQSIKDQETNVECECILIDGVSTDGTLPILKKLVGENDVLVSEADNGIYDALNKGIAIASGQIIGFLHSDDFYPNKNVLNFVASKFEEQSLDLLAGDVEFFCPGNADRVVRRYRSGALNENRLSWGLMPGHPAVFIRKTVFEQYGAFKAGYKIAADFEFFCRIANQKNLKYQYYSIPFVKMQTGGISTSGWRSMLTINSESVRACRENGIKTNYFKITCKYFHKIFELTFG